MNSSAWPIRILHLGLGRFHRAHQAVYFQNYFNETGEKWGIASFSMRSSDARDEMRRVQNRYPVAFFSKNESRIQTIESIRASYFAKEDHDKFLELFDSRDLALVTLTVTEKAYSSPELFELLVDGLRVRSRAGLPLTIVCCDNLQGNGRKLGQGVLQAAQQSGDTALAKWIEQNVTFPNTMVDRIVPALTPERLEEIQRLFKTDNPETLATEVFTQWVIEDRFASARPALEKVGVQFVSDVEPFEKMKLRLLNAAHSLIAYSGLAKGYRFVHEAIRDGEIRERVETLFDEVIPLIAAPKGFDLRLYTKSLIERFDNENLPHQLKQIAMDGSEKLKQRVLPSLQLAREKKMPVAALVSVLDFWCQHCFTNQPDDPCKSEIERLRKENPNYSDFRSKTLQQLLAFE